MKKLMILLAAAMLLSIPAAASEWEGDTASGSLGEMTWALEGTTLTVSGNGAMAELEEGAPWEPYRDQIETVVFSGNITYVAASAFEDCDKITKVDFGPAMYELGKRSFYSCDGLTILSMPDTFKVFGEESLRGCSNLTEIHCAGRFPSFRLNCLWDTYTKIYYPAEKPWGIEYIQQLEEAFHGRIEFLASDGTDPYDPAEETEPTTAPATEAPTQAPTLPPETAVPTTTAAPTQPTTVPGTEPPTTEAPATESATLPTTQPTEATQPQKDRGSGAGVGIALIVMVLSLTAAGALIFRGTRHKGKYSR